MNLRPITIRLACFLGSIPFATTFAAGQVPHQTNEPRALVQNFYTEVVARHPHDIPTEADMKIFAPYLSKSLLHRMKVGKACSADWDRENTEPHLKAEMASLFGPFSGVGVEAEPGAFRLEKTQSRKDGSLRVYVSLMSGKPPDDTWDWRVAAVVVRESGRYVIDDAVYINESVYDDPADKPADHRLSEYLSAGCNGHSWGGYSVPKQPTALVRSLYQQVVARDPGGIPTGVDWKIFAQYMSKGLMHRIDLFNACAADWKRQYPNPNPPLKAPFGVYESGIFSGGNEKTGPRTFRIEKTQSQKDGSFRVYVRLAWWEAPVNPPDKWRTTVDRPYIWHVAAILMRENDRYVVDDVIYLKDEKDPTDVDWRLSQVLTEGCDGPHWVGDRTSK